MFAKDEWMSGILGVTSYHLKAKKEDTQAFIDIKASGLEKYLDEKELFIDTKMKSTDVSTISRIEDCGFKLVDTNLTFDMAVTSKSLKGTAEICEAKAEHKEASSKLAGSCFEFSRFHLDPNINNTISNTLKEKWVENYFNGKRGDQLFIAKVGPSIAGFIQLLEQEDKVIIDLIGVSSQFRRQYIAHDLMAHTCNVYKHKQKIIVGTQVSNTPSVRMYENFGFRLCDSSYVFHYHTK
jgi:hypothetical protein